MVINNTVLLKILMLKAYLYHIDIHSCIYLCDIRLMNVKGGCGHHYYGSMVRSEMSSLINTHTYRVCVREREAITIFHSIFDGSRQFSVQWIPIAIIYRHYDYILRQHTFAHTLVEISLRPVVMNFYHKLIYTFLYI